MHLTHFNNGYIGVEEVRSASVELGCASFFLSFLLY